MKITKRQLRRIIKEEKRRLHEAFSDDPAADDIIDGFYNAINQMIWEEWGASGVSPEENPEEVQYVIQALTNLITDLQGGNF